MSMAQADRITAMVLLALGLAMAGGGWTMDRLEVRGIHPASIPGLVPMILGGLMALCAVLLWRSASENGARGAQPFMAGGSWGRLAATAALTLIYALILVGWLPFFWATAIFVTAFAAVFSWPEEPDRRAQAIAVGGALVLGFATAGGISALFRYVFLVRLP